MWSNVGKDRFAFCQKSLLWWWETQHFCCLLNIQHVFILRLGPNCWGPLCDLWVFWEAKLMRNNVTHSPVFSLLSTTNRQATMAVTTRVSWVDEYLFWTHTSLFCQAVTCATIQSWHRGGQSRTCNWGVCMCFRNVQIHLLLFWNV